MKRLRILLADDHHITLAGLRTVLQSQPGWTICGEANTGCEAIEKARHLKPDVVVMDFSMPEMDGLEATRRIRELLPNTEVLFLTMHESGTLAEEALGAGARGFVLKTEVNRLLVASVRKLAEHKLSYTAKAADMVLEAVRQHGSTSASAKAMDPSLTPRQCEVVRLIAGGKTTKEIAATLNISIKTADVHRNNIMRKLNLHNAAELVHYAIRTKLVNP
ncbi:MAG: response regulator transcription factor [Verrucomicrobiia bacterium]|jgi:DNA-binding NarL/FixJ family response regulator